MIFWSITCFTSVFIFIDLSVLLSSVSLSFTFSLISCRLRYFLSFLVPVIAISTGLFVWCPFRSCSVFSCMRYFVYNSSLISNTLFDARACVMVFLFFFLSYVFCCLSSTTFGTSKSFFFSNLCLNFLSVINDINFVSSNSVLFS